MMTSFRVSTACLPLRQALSFVSIIFSFVLAALFVLISPGPARAAGAAWTIGANGFGQLGNRITIDRYAPGPVNTNDQYTALAGGFWHTLGLRTDGTVWAWGRNLDGALGDGLSGDANSSGVPVQVLGIGGAGTLTDATAISAGVYHSLALLSDGSVVAWGDNEFGELGNGTTVNAAAPVQVLDPNGSSALGSVVAIAAGWYHNLALKKDGTVVAWGSNSDGQLGDGTGTNRLLPVVVSGSSGTGSLSGIAAVAGGEGHSVALKSDGTVWSWGRNEEGELGDGTFSGRGHPVQVEGVGGPGTLQGVTMIACGGDHTLAYLGGTSVVTWGDNEYGQLGDGSGLNWEPAPVQANLGAVPDGIAGGGYFSLAWQKNGQIWAWGDNRSGELGDTTATERDTPVFLGSGGGLNGVVGVQVVRVQSVAAGGLHTLLIRPSAGPLSCWAWGDNTSGQIGNGTMTNSSIPYPVSASGTVIAAAGGPNHSLEARSDGAVLAWGANESGELGNGTTTSSLTPVQVSGLGSVTSVAAGAAHSLALRTDGTVWAWGLNSSGQLGNGATTNSSTPVQVTGLSSVMAIAAGSNHSLALRTDGTVWTWGANESGELGNGTTANSSTPVQVTGLTGVLTIGAGDSHSLAGRGDGTVWCWGLNSSGQLGNGATTSSSTPVQALGLNGVLAVAGAGSNSLALRSDGHVWGWGLLFYGSLPNDLPGPGSVIAISAAPDFTLALRSDSTAWAWGDNQSGELGIGTTIFSANPVQVSGLSSVLTIAAGGKHVLAVAQAPVIPIISGFLPASGPVGTTVKLIGSSLSGAQVVTFNGVDANFAVNSDTQITAIVPNTATTGSVSVLTGVGTGVSAKSFLVTNTTITSFSPTSGLPGTLVYINGTAFTGATAVSFNGAAASFTVTGPTQIMTTVPAGATTGPITVTTSPGPVSSATSFIVPTTTVSFFYPYSGPAGLTVNISGSFFTGATLVTLSGVSIPFKLKSDGEIDIVVPANVPSGPFSVTTSLGTGTSPTSFIVTSPLITSFSPTSGHAGVKVSINGVNFAGATSVKFNRVSASYTVDSNTHITAVVPADVTTGPISVTTPLGTATSATSFTVTAPANITFTPDHGIVGTAVQISGSGFSGASAVKFNGASTFSYTVNSDSSITATVPTGATTGPISITTRAGTGASAGNFKVVKSISFDFNGDGYADLLWQNQATGGVYAWLMNGVQYTGLSASIVDSATWKVVGVADFNGDGSQDLVWQSPSSGGVYVWYLNGIHYTGNGGSIVDSADPAWKVVGTPDLNGDGHPDILWQNSSTGGVYYWLMNGLTFTGQGGYIVSSTDPAWKVVATPDLNGDGSPDILWQNTTTGGVYVWYMNGVNYTGTGTYIVSSTDLAWKVVGVPDLNGDGKPDLLWQNSSTGGVAYWLMDGAVYNGQGGVIVAPPADLNAQIVGIH